MNKLVIKSVTEEIVPHCVLVKNSVSHRVLHIDYEERKPLWQNMFVWYLNIFSP